MLEPPDETAGEAICIPGDPKVISMLEFKGTIIVATECGVFRYRGDKLERIEFVPP